MPSRAKATSTFLTTCNAKEHRTGVFSQPPRARCHYASDTFAFPASASKRGSDKWALGLLFLRFGVQGPDRHGTLNPSDFRVYSSSLTRTKVDVLKEKGLGCLWHKEA